MHWDHVIKNGIIVDGKESYQANIYIKNEKISAISRDELEGEAGEVTDAAGKYVLPGLIDVHVHSRDGENGATYKEDFYHSTMSAAAGGLTTVFEMPNSNPAIYNAEMLEKQIKHLTPKAHVDFAIWGLCLGKLNMHELQALSEAGVIAFKFFWGYAIDSKTYQLIYNYSPGMENAIPPLGDGEIYQMFAEIAKTGKLVGIHAENFDLIQTLTREVEKSGDKSYAAFLKGRPNVAEETIIQTAISFAKQTGARLHILHLAAKEGIDIIKRAQEEGYPVSAETCSHYLALCDEDFDRVGPVMKVYPPVRRREDQEMLWSGLKEGVLSLVSSDHAPHTEEEKAGDLWSIPAGMASIETLAPLMIDAVSQGRITIHELAAVLSEKPAKLFGIYPEKGSLKVGTDADITIVDLQVKHTVKKENLHSKSKVTPFDGFQLTGAPVQTIVRGKTIMKDGEIVSGPVGKFIKPLE
ncbi:allantoinase AllB [Candidatus Formimonas warabiya]|uniref:allantoinase n=1 Tax=Formimonas warabiya TaxID=1761012 RepID=A0A3G1KR24_FORW1|nr:allantoinase AllB [Candidatus Formimonas warabiya]ATW24887.1 allantoinase [Candidatus Formimonas warabiya]